MSRPIHLPVVLALLLGCPGPPGSTSGRTTDGGRLDGGGACSEEAPLANAGPDLSAAKRQRVTLNASGSRAVVGSIRSYRWRLVEVPAGSASLLSGDTLVNPSFIPDRSGTYVATLVVSDGCRESAEDSVVINATNRRPTANAGMDQTIPSRMPVQLRGTSSADADGDALQYTWTLTSRPVESAAELRDQGGGIASFDPDRSGSYVVSLVVSDGEAESPPALVHITVRNRAPVANPGMDQTVGRDATVTLASAGSTDPDGDLVLTAAWTLIARPQGSTAAITTLDISRASFRADVPGTYVAQLVVNDGDLSSAPASVAVVSANRAPQIAPLQDVTVAGLTEVSLTAQASDPDGDPITVEWTIDSRPPGSTAELTDAQSATVGLVPDRMGSWLLRVVARDDLVMGVPVTVNVHVQPPIMPLSHRVKDAEFSRASNQLVMISSAPPALYIFDPLAGTEQTVTLALEPVSVSVAPSGLRAAVGHNGHLSFVDLAAATVLDVVPVATNVGNVIMVTDTLVAAFSAPGTWGVPRTVDLTTRQDSVGTGSARGSQGRLHPSGAIYAIDTETTSNSIHRYDLNNGVVQWSYDSPYHGGSAVCGDVFFSEDGARIFTQCRSAFRASTTRTEDMQYAGGFPDMPLFRWLDHSSAARRVAAIPRSTSFPPNLDAESEIRLYESEFLAVEGRLQIPRFLVNGESFRGMGRWVFHTSDGNNLVVVIQADPASNLLLDYGVVVY